MDPSAARRRIGDCIARLLRDRQFYGYLLQQFDLRHAPRLPAGMGVGYDPAAGRLVLSFNPELWVQPTTLPWEWGVTPTVPWTDANLVAVLEHECLHVVLRHLVRRPPGDRKLWNIAGDMVINQQLEGLPSGCVTLEWGGKTYPRGLHAEGYYQLLQRDQPPCPIHGAGKASAESPSKPSDAGKGPGQGSGTDADEPESQNGEGREDGEPGGHGQGPPCPHCSGQTTDCHDDFSATGDPDADEAMRGAVGYANQRHKEAEANPGGTGRGDLPADVKRMIEAMLHRPVNWRHRLRCVGDSAVHHGRRSTLFRRHRRYGALFPGRKPARSGKVVVAIDTSGSVGDRLLGAFWCEVQNIARKVAVVVVECDAAVHDCWPLRGRGIPHLKGGGGSSFQGVFDLVAGAKGCRPAWRNLARGANKLVFLTDGDIGVPDTNPTGLDVFWVVPPGAKAPTEAYGERIEMDLPGES